MNNIETLKQELITQKDLIIEKGGVVNVANQNPSPSEITAGIESIETPDFTLATATENDVLYGKTFYAGNLQLKTGTSIIGEDLVRHIFLPNENVRSTEDVINYQFPSGTLKLRHYLFFNNVNSINITFNDEIQNIGQYTFYNAYNMKFYNFDNLKKLKTIDMYAFQNSEANGITLARLPNSVQKLASNSFANCFHEEDTDFRFPNNLNNLGTNVYIQNSRKYANSLDLTNYKLTILTSSTFYNIGFDCDLIVPNSVTNIGANFNYGGCFNNIVIPSNVVQLSSGCFGSSTSDSIDKYYMKSITFQSETPPSITSTSIARQNVENGLKIYVPDTAVDVYKAVSNLSYFVDCIYPISQKE